MTDTITLPPAPADGPRARDAALAAAEPYSLADLVNLLRRPGNAFEVVLARRDRLAATITHGEAVWGLAVALSACTALARCPTASCVAPAPGGASPSCSAVR